MLKKIKIQYRFEDLVKCDYPSSSSCIKHQVHELSDIHKKFGGFPKTYTEQNTIIKQRWWESDEIDFKEFGDQLGMEVVTVSSIMQPPGCIVPWHRDTFFLVKKKFPNRNETPVRASIFLEDWKMGHFLQYENEVLTKWKAGDGFLWGTEVLHLGANAGMEPKYTLQISGFLKND
jgi:hypothetical protein